MAKFKEGDRVRHPYKGIGTVLEISSNPFVEYERYIRGHNAGGLGKEGHCWAQNEDLLKLVEEARPTITDKAIEDFPFHQFHHYHMVARASAGMDLSSEPIKKTIIQKTMNAFKKAMLPAATKKFIEAGYIDEDTLKPTNAGMSALNFILWTDNEAKLLAAAEAEIAERKKDF